MIVRTRIILILAGFVFATLCCTVSAFAQFAGGGIQGGANNIIYFGGFEQPGELVVLSQQAIVLTQQDEQSTIIA